LLTWNSHHCTLLSNVWISFEVRFVTSRNNLE
jgi:hypothetical protein